MDYFQKNNERTFKIIKTNPFKKIKKLSKGNGKQEDFQESLLYGLVKSEDSYN